MAIFSGAIASGIEMAPFDLFSTCTARGNLNRPLDERNDQLTLVFGRPAHIGLRIGGGAGRLASRSDCFVAQWFSAECILSIRRTNRHKTDASKSDSGICADTALHRELHGGACARIHWSTPLEGEIGAAAALGRNLHFNFGDEFVVCKGRCISIFDEVIQGNLARSARTEAMDGSVEGDQRVGPVAARI